VTPAVPLGCADVDVEVTVAVMRSPLPACYPVT
jgi:hypothetical protein